MTTAAPRNDRNAPRDAEPKRLVVVSAGTGDPSSTRQLTDRIATRAERTAGDVDFDSPLMRLAAGGRLDAAEREAA